MSEKIIYFCQSASEDDPIVADTIQKIKSLAARPEIAHIFVIALRKTISQNTDKLTFYQLGSDKSKLKALINFFKIMTSICRKNKIKSCYLYMTPTILPLFWILKLFFGYQLVCWFAHTKYTLKTKICLRYFCDKWVSIDKAQVLNYSHVKLIGQGIDISLFSPQDLKKEYDLITVGRITPIKKIDLILKAMSILKLQGIETKLLVAGEAYVTEDLAYKKKLLELTEYLNLQNQVLWPGNIARNTLPLYYAKARAMVFPVPGGIGKATVEALACGLPTIINDEKASQFLGVDLSRTLISQDNAESMAEKIKSILQLSPADYQALSHQCRELIVNEHSLEKFSERLSFQLV